MNMNNTWGPMLCGLLFSLGMSIAGRLGDIILLLESMKELQIIAVGS